MNIHKKISVAAILGLCIMQPAQAVEAPQPVFDGEQLVWAPVDANRINVHRGDGSYIETLPGTSTSWVAPVAGSYFLVGTDAGDWTGWARSVTVDTTVPGPNAGLALNTVSALVYSSTALELFWSSFSETPFAKVEVSRDGAMAKTLLGTSFFESNLEPGTTYTYTLTPFDSAGNAGVPSVQSVTTNDIFGQEMDPGDLPPPDVGDDFVPMPPRALRAEVYSNFAIELFWEHSEANLAQAAFYNIYQDGNLIRQSLNGRSFYVDGLIPGTDYEFAVSAVDANGMGESELRAVQLRTNGTPPEITETVESVLVNLEITVPGTLSDRQIVEVSFNRETFRAEYAGGQLWLFSEFFPPNTEDELFITVFSDDGEFLLGGFQQSLATGEAGTGDTYVIDADQFDTQRFDDDSDGFTNLDEIIAGTDPLVAEQIRRIPIPALEADGPAGLGLLGIVSGYYESELPSERPYLESVQVVPETDIGSREERTLDINIDSTGTGTFSDEVTSFFSSSDSTRIDRIATRTNNDGTINWSGTYVRVNRSAFRGSDIAFTTDTSAIDGTTRLQSGSLIRMAVGFPTPDIEISYSLVGTVLPDSFNCEPVAGSISFNAEYLLSSDPFDVIIATYQTTVAKDEGDLLWTVTDKTPEGDVVNQYRTETAGVTFFCGHADL